ncbi:putative holin-like toxin [Oceanobacillus polygoni]|uniref:putative holin-like toxin n=1 Tax=Oceanobacillus polygoni TaxID=1235259 RepID=UPI003CCC5263
MCYTIVCTIVWLTQGRYVRLTLRRKGVMHMSTFEAISLMISFGALIALLAMNKEK